MRQSFVLRVQLNCRETVRTKRFRTCLAFLVGFGLLIGLFQGQYQKRPVLRIIRLAFRGFTKIIRRRGCIIGLERQQTQVEWIIVFRGIQVRRAAKISLCRSRLALPRPRNRQIV